MKKKPVPMMPNWKQVALFAWVKYGGEWAIIHEDVGVFELYHDGQYVDEYEAINLAQVAQLSAEIAE